MRPHASLFVTLGIPLLAFAVLVAIGVAVAKVAEPAHRRRDTRRYVVGASVWVAYSFALATSGLLARFDAGPPPPFVLLLGPLLIASTVLAFSSAGTRLAAAPLHWLVGFHAFRLPLELVMHEAAREGTMPVQMTFTGWNFDIVTGLGAVVVAALAAKNCAPRWVVIGWNAVGTTLLAVVMTIAIASLPAFHVFGRGAAVENRWIAYAPFQLLPAVLVAAALVGHLVLWRRLFFLDLNALGVTAFPGRRAA